MKDIGGKVNFYLRDRVTKTLQRGLFKQEHSSFQIVLLVFLKKTIFKLFISFQFLDIAGRVRTFLMFLISTCTKCNELAKARVQEFNFFFLYLYEVIPRKHKTTSVFQALPLSPWLSNRYRNVLIP